MRGRKVYGQSRADKCPFCGKQAIVKSKEEIPVCLAHKESSLPPMKCACGSWVDLAHGKWGPYFQCIKCGNKNFRQILEINPIQAAEQNPKPSAIPSFSPSKEKSVKQEQQIRSDDPIYFD